MKDEFLIPIAKLGQAIYCECYIEEYKRYKILGSITSAGAFEVLRGHKNKTVITGGNFLICCPECGHQEFVNIISMAVNQPTIYEPTQ